MEKVRVKDKTTGNILESSNDMVVDSWKADPDRFMFPKSKPGELNEGSESDQSENRQNQRKREQSSN